MPLTNYAIQAVISNLFGGAALSTPATYYLALSTTPPTQPKGGGTPFWNFSEPTSGTGNYQRLAITNNNTNFGATASEPTNGYSQQNSVTFTMATSTAAWSTGSTPLIAGGLFDAATAGNLWAFGSLSPSVTVNQTGIAVTFTAAQLIATFT